MIVVFNQFALLSVSAFSYVFNHCDQWLKFSTLPTSDSDPGVVVVPGKLGLSQCLHILVHEASFEVQAFFAILSSSCDSSSACT